MFILPSDLPEETAHETVERVKSTIVSRGGEIETFEQWGRRRFTYPIKHRRDGVYHLARFSVGPDQALEVDRTLQRNEQLLRHLIVRVD